MNYAAVTGARTACVRNPTLTLAQVKTAAVSASAGVVNSSQVTVAVNGTTVTTDVAFQARASGTPNFVTVTVTYPFVSVTGSRRNSVQADDRNQQGDDRMNQRHTEQGAVAIIVPPL